MSRGEIASGADASAEYVVAALRSAFEDEGSKAVVLLINSPGGSPVQAGMINDEIVRLKANICKPVYAVVEETCASAALLHRCCGGRYLCGQGQHRRQHRRAHGRFRIHRHHGETRRGAPFAHGGRKQRAFWTHSVPRQKSSVPMRKPCWTRSTSNSSRWSGGPGRPASKSTPDTFSGLFWTGQQAIELGLADQLGNLDYVAREVVKAEDIIDYTRHENVAERLAKRFGAAMGAGACRRPVRSCRSCAEGRP